MADPFYTKSTSSDVTRVANKYIEIVDSCSSAAALIASTPKFFVCPVGIVGSGKTTFLKLLERQLNLVRVSGDEIRGILAEEGGDQRTAWQVGAHVIDHYVDLGLNIAHDTDGATVATQTNVNALAEAHHYQVFWVHVVAPEDFILHKLAHHPPSHLFKGPEQAIATYYARKAVHSDLSNLNFTAQVDTSRDDLPRQVEEVVRLIGARLENQ